MHNSFLSRMWLKPDYVPLLLTNAGLSKFKYLHQFLNLTFNNLLSVFSEKKRVAILCVFSDLSKGGIF